MKIDNLKNIPTVFIIFGATGDLVSRKLAPALFHLFEHGQLPALFSVIGFSRQNLSDHDFRRHLKKSILKHLGLKKNRRLDNFLNYFSYQSGHFEKRQDYQKLAQRLGQIDGQWKVCANKLFYLAVPPQYYEGLFRRLASSGLTKPCSPSEGWTRVLVEKPFGRDLKTAQKLDRILGQLFKEEQIYRIDHYLAKEMLQNILSFRFANNLFEKSWHHHLIESIEIKLLETIGVENRGSFYDGVGALQDVGQNHLLQMLALMTMDHPLEFKAESIRRKRAAALKSLKFSTQTQVKNFSFRAQYQGYKNIKGVKKKSKTETYFKIKAFLNSSHWQGVPIILESGKKLKDRKKEIIVTFKHSSPCFCPPKTKIHFKNKLIFHLEPKEGITIQFWSKKPGLEFKLQERNFNFLYRKNRKKLSYTEEYEKLLLDCISGDQTLFISTEEVESMWKFIDPFIKAWRRNLVPLKNYSQNTNTIQRESKVIEGPLISDLTLKKEIGLVGLGKMGGNIAQQLIAKDWLVLGLNRTPEATHGLEKHGLVGAYSLQELTQKLSSPRIIWLMVPAGRPVEEVIFGRQGLVKFLKPGDIIIDGGNSFYQDSIKRSKKLAKKGIYFIDVGVSGGPDGARYGASLMIGGKKEIYKKLLPLFMDLSIPGGIQFFKGAGAGHFVKMVHNGIEYGMMQALAEGFTILKKADYKLDLTKVVDVYNHGTVIKSRLMEWLSDAFELHGENLKGVSSTVGHTGEGAWTVKTAQEMKVKAKIIEQALKFRIQSKKNPSYTGKVLSAIREQFGGHQVK